MKVNYDNTKRYTLMQDVKYGEVFMIVDTQKVPPAFYLKVNPNTFSYPNPDCYGVNLDTGALRLFDKLYEVRVMNAEVQITRK